MSTIASATAACQKTRPCGRSWHLTKVCKSKDDAINECIIAAVIARDTEPLLTYQIFN